VRGFGIVAPGEKPGLTNCNVSGAVFAERLEQVAMMAKQPSVTTAPERSLR
jgi:hypothetical protein